MSPLHQPFYCEENIWHLCQDAALAARPRLVTFVSNPSGGFVIWHQKASPRASTPIRWDYHVILLVAEPWEIWDLDTTLGSPLPAGEYLRHSFPQAVPARVAPWFRLVPAAEFVASFASDRGHMRRADGRYHRPPPPWPAILPEGRASNLEAFIDVTEDFLGTVVALGALSSLIAAEAR
ncbi:MAG: hypothetical protein ABI193_16195 [Minicystis sp.]